MNHDFEKTSGGKIFENILQGQTFGNEEIRNFPPFFVYVQKHIHTFFGFIVCLQKENAFSS